MNAASIPLTAPADGTRSVITLSPSCSCLRCGDYLSVPVGGEVQGAGHFWLDRDAGFPRHPDRWLYMDMGKRRAGVGVEQQHLAISSQLELSPTVCTYD